MMSFFYIVCIDRYDVDEMNVIIYSIENHISDRLLALGITIRKMIILDDISCISFAYKHVDLDLIKYSFFSNNDPNVNNYITYMIFYGRYHHHHIYLYNDIQK
jgi:hypothetical protein